MTRALMRNLPIDLLGEIGGTNLTLHWRRGMKPQYAILALRADSWSSLAVVGIAGFRGDHFSKPSV